MSFLRCTCRARRNDGGIRCGGEKQILETAQNAVSGMKSARRIGVEKRNGPGARIASRPVAFAEAEKRLEKKLVFADLSGEERLLYAVEGVEVKRADGNLSGVQPTDVRCAVEDRLLWKSLDLGRSSRVDAEESRGILQREVVAGHVADGAGEAAETKNETVDGDVEQGTRGNGLDVSHDALAGNQVRGALEAGDAGGDGKIAGVDGECGAGIKNDVELGSRADGAEDGGVAAVGREHFVVNGHEEGARCRSLKDGAFDFVGGGDIEEVDVGNGND